MLYGIVVALLPNSDKSVRTWAHDGWGKPERGAEVMKIDDARRVANEARENTLNTQYWVGSVIVNSVVPVDDARTRDAVDKVVQLLNSGAQQIVITRDGERIIVGTK